MDDIQLVERLSNKKKFKVKISADKKWISKCLIEKLLSDFGIPFEEVHAVYQKNRDEAGVESGPTHKNFYAILCKTSDVNRLIQQRMWSIFVTGSTSVMVKFLPFLLEDIYQIKHPEMNLIPNHEDESKICFNLPNQKSSLEEESSSSGLLGLRKDRISDLSPHSWGGFYSKNRFDHSLKPTNKVYHDNKKRKDQFLTNFQTDNLLFKIDVSPAECKSLLQKHKTSPDSEASLRHVFGMKKNSTTKKSSKTTINIDSSPKLSLKSKVFKEDIDKDRIFSQF